MALSEVKEGGDPLLPYRMRRLSKFSIAELDAQMYAHSSDVDQLEHVRPGAERLHELSATIGPSLADAYGIAGEK